MTNHFTPPKIDYDDIFLWIYHPLTYAGITKEERLFLKSHGISISTDYIGMVRAYRSAEHYPDNLSKVIWQSSCANNLFSIIDGNGPIDNKNLGKTLKNWVVHLMSLPPSGLQQIFGQNLGLLST